MKDLECWLFLARAPLVGAATAKKMLKYFGEPQTIIKSSQREKKRSNLFKPVTLEYFEKLDDSIIAADLELLQQKNVNIIHLGHANYPKLLTEIFDPPIVLFTRGNLELLKLPQISIVGSRNPDLAGKKISFSFAKSLSNRGLTITSGMATGIDTQAHRGALSGKSSTIAVFGTGIDRIYPVKNQKLAHEIAEKGLIISEFGANTKPKPQNFPRRNRIVSGLSLGTLVVQANIRSGSLITSRTAMEQGREVFAIPGSIQNPLSQGCHHLIKQGAKLVENVNDIFNELSGMVAYVKQNASSKVKTPDNTEANPLLEHIGYEPTPLDQLPAISGLAMNQINSDLVYLELEGKVEMLPGAKVQRI